MKNMLRKLFSPILNIFEEGDEPYEYNSLSRKILIVIGVLFSGLAAAVGYIVADQDDLGFLIPVIVFSGVSLTTLVIGVLGNDRAVAKIWGNH